MNFAKKNNTLHAISGVFARKFFGVGALLTVSGITYAAQNNCSAWQVASADAKNSLLPLELRTCDLTYGLSAYVEIKNSSDKRLQLFYRVITKDDKSKDSDFVLEPLATARASTCQACASRHAGFKAWEILDIKELPPSQGQAGVAPATAAPVPAADVQPVAIPKPSATPSIPKTVSQPVATPAAPVITPAATSAVTKELKEPAPSNPETVAPPIPASKQAEGFRAEDGTFIPYDQLPPEFRPRK